MPSISCTSPYFYERFERAMQKAEEWLRMHDLLRIAESASRSLVLKADYKNVSVAVDTILISNRWTTTSGYTPSTVRPLRRNLPLRAVEEQLPDGEFIRIHRSFVVPEKRIVKFSSTEVVLSKCGKRLPVGKNLFGSGNGRLEPGK